MSSEPNIDEGQQAKPPVVLPLVAVVGRPNVGKSTLFNRLVGERRSIVGDEPGITRDRIYGEADWAGRRFSIVDTGGIVPDETEVIPASDPVFTTLEAEKDHHDEYPTWLKRLLRRIKDVREDT